MTEVDLLLDDEDWAILNELTEDELELFSNDLDPCKRYGNGLSNASEVDKVIADRKLKRHVSIDKSEFGGVIRDRASKQNGVQQKTSVGISQQSLTTAVCGTKPTPMYHQDEVKIKLEKKFERQASQSLIQNDVIRAKEAKRSVEKKQAAIKREKWIKQLSQHSRDDPDLAMAMLAGDDADDSDFLDEEERALIEEATEEELVEVAAMLKMNGVLTSEQVCAVEQGDKPDGGLTRHSAVKATPLPQHMVNEEDEETDLDVVALMRCLKEDSDDLFFLCINNQPKLEKHVLHEIFNRVSTTTKIKHLSLALTGINDDDAKFLAKQLRYNESIETMNLESNLITNRGMEPLMKVVGRHPAMREVKVSNQKNAIGGQGEECMAKAIEANENILKFGHSFTNPGARNKADRAILKHNEAVRQRKRQGEEVYDLKSECKNRDSSKQPWIVLKCRRSMAGLLEESVSKMGHMNECESSEGSGNANPMMRSGDAMGAMLAGHKNRLKGDGSNSIAELERQRDEKTRQQLGHASSNGSATPPVSSNAPMMGGMLGDSMKNELLKKSQAIAKSQEERIRNEDDVGNAATKAAAEKPTSKPAVKVAALPDPPAVDAAPPRRRRVRRYEEEEEAEPLDFSAARDEAAAEKSDVNKEDDRVTTADAVNAVEQDTEGSNQGESVATAKAEEEVTKVSEKITEAEVSGERESKTVDKPTLEYKPENDDKKVDMRARIAAKKAALEVKPIIDSPTTPRRRRRGNDDADDDKKADIFTDVTAKSTPETPPSTDQAKETIDENNNTLNNNDEAVTTTTTTSAAANDGSEPAVIDVQNEQDNLQKRIEARRQARLKKNEEPSSRSESPLLNGSAGESATPSPTESRAEQRRRRREEERKAEEVKLEEKKAAEAEAVMDSPATRRRLRRKQDNAEEIVTDSDSKSRLQATTESPSPTPSASSRLSRRAEQPTAAAEKEKSESNGLPDTPKSRLKFTRDENKTPEPALKPVAAVEERAVSPAVDLFSAPAAEAEAPRMSFSQRRRLKDR